MVLVSVSIEKNTSQKFVILDFSKMNSKILKCFRKEKRYFRQAVQSGNRSYSSDSHIWTMVVYLGLESCLQQGLIP